MLGKNNFDERLRQIENQSKKDRFSIRKLTVGAASVLIGLSFVGANAQTAKADTVAPDAQSTEEVSASTETTPAENEANEKAASSATNTEAASSKAKDNSKTDLSSYKGLKSFLKDANSNNDTEKDESADSAASANTTVTNDNTSKPEAQADDFSSASVADAQNFVLALGKGEIKTVNLESDIEVPNGITDTWINKLGEIGVRGDKVINGNGHTLKLNNNQLSGNIIKSGSVPSITFNDITVEGTGSYLTNIPIVNNYPWTTLGDFSNINLHNAHTKNITFGGGFDAPLIAANINISGDTTIDYLGNDKGSRGATLFDGNVNVANGSKVTINAKNLVQVFNGEALNSIESLIPNLSNVLSQLKDNGLIDGITNTIGDMRLGSRFVIGDKANVNVNLDSTVTRLADSAILNIDVNDGARFKMVDNAPAVDASLLDATANWVYLTANNPASVKIVTTNPNLRRPAINYLGTCINGKNIGMADVGQSKNWVFDANNSNLISATYIPFLSDAIDSVITTVFPQLNLTGLDETLYNDYQTPADKIATNGKADKTFVDMGTKKDLLKYFSFLNGPLVDATMIPGGIGDLIGDPINNLLGINAVPGLQFGTDLDDVLVKTGAGRFDVSAKPQDAVSADSLGSAENILSAYDNSTKTTRSVANLKKTKTITDASWVIDRAMTKDGSLIAGGVIASSDGKLNKAAGNATADQLGNAVIQVSYTDGTSDYVPVLVKVVADPVKPDKPTDETKPADKPTDNTNNGGSVAPAPAPAPAPSTPATDNNSDADKDKDSQKATEKTLGHDAYVYDETGTRTTKKYKAGATLDTYGTKNIDGRKYYDLGDNKYIVASNIDGKKRKLKKNAYVYKKNGKRANKKTLKKNKYVTTYGGPSTIKGKKYYTIGGNKYVKKANFRK
ncbi:SLAP domain-containing protein [Lactobacillus sp. ESL0681]|uniref:SLAP domain-containing protein n=1 Tax=Lactobacillus sp. ESL0681 TaxID=2983211 RepID=UPI0023F68103|nr:SLAP domain-containing protein [Lactobacillus sp. ESL0681]WEV40906.1 SLAP domain-containing protein [Lactobacillus sp. ESL0681]